MNRSLINEPTPLKRSAHDTSAHNTPRAPRMTSTTGIPPAALKRTSFSKGKSSVGRHASSHNPARMAVAEVDHGSDTASARARQSASPARFLYLRVVMFKSRLVTLDPKNKLTREERTVN